MKIWGVGQKLSEIKWRTLRSPFVCMCDCQVHCLKVVLKCDTKSSKKHNPNFCLFQAEEAALSGRCSANGKVISSNDASSTSSLSRTRRRICSLADQGCQVKYFHYWIWLGSVYLKRNEYTNDSLFYIVQVKILTWWTIQFLSTECKYYSTVRRLNYSIAFQSFLGQKIIFSSSSSLG